MRHGAHIALACAAVLGSAMPAAVQQRFGDMLVAQQSYEDYVVRARRTMDAIAVANRLTERDTATAIETVSLFIYLGPCEGSSFDVPERLRGPGFMSYFGEAASYPDRPLYAASLEMLSALLVLHNPLMRPPPSKGSYLCRFALGTAVPRR